MWSKLICMWYCFVLLIHHSINSRISWPHLRLLEQLSVPDESGLSSGPRPESGPTSWRFSVQDSNLNSPVECEGNLATTSITLLITRVIQLIWLANGCSLSPHHSTCMSPEAVCLMEEDNHPRSKECTDLPSRVYDSFAPLLESSNKLSSITTHP